MDLADFEFLLTEQGQHLLAEAHATYDEAALSTSQRLRKTHHAGHVAAALTQVALRHRAVEKFAHDSDRMYFTPDGLEQATHGVVAAHRAGRVARGGFASVADLGCGIGSDAAALARAGASVAAFDRDHLTSRVAAANLRVLDVDASVAVADATTVSRAAADLVFADPARRGARGRVFDPRDYSPSWSFVEELLSETSAVKVAPGIAHNLVPPGVEAEWVSLDGQLREAVLWSGGAAQRRRRATVLRTGDAIAHQTSDLDEPGTPTVAPVGRYVYEPDDAVIRAGLVSVVAGATSGWLLDEHIAYVSSDRLLSTPLARAYEVLEVLPYKQKHLKAALRERSVGALTIKKRGVAVVPEDLRRRLRLTGDVSATLVISRTAKSAVALLVEPVGPPS